MYIIHYSSSKNIGYMCPMFWNSSMDPPLNFTFDLLMSHLWEFNSRYKVFHIYILDKLSILLNCTASVFLTIYLCEIPIFGVSKFISDSQFISDSELGNCVDLTVTDKCYVKYSNTELLHLHTCRRLDLLKDHTNEGG